MFKLKVKTSSAFSEFMRNAPASEKKRVYGQALKKASADQAAVIAHAKADEAIA